MGFVSKDFGIVLREIDAGENSKRYILLTKTHGKVVVFARGAKGANSKLSVPKLAYCEFVFYDGGQFLSLSQVSVVAQFGDISGDYDAYCVAAFILEMADKMLLDNMECSAALKLVMAAFSRLDRGASPKLVHGTFVVKMLQNEGFFSKELLLGEGFVPEVGMAVDYIMDAANEKAFSFKASEDVLEVLQCRALRFLREHVDVQLKSLGFFDFE